MNFLQRAVSALTERRNLNNPAIPLAQGWQYLTGGHGSDAGEVVNDSSTLQLSSAWACCRLISEAIGSLNLRLLEVTPDGKQEAVDEPLFDLLSLAPNSEMSSIQLWEQIGLSLATRGNSYTQIIRDQTGVKELWPLHPHQVEPQRQDGNLVYRVNVAHDGETPQYRVLDKADVLHCRLMSYGGLTGISPVDANRLAIGLGIGLMRHASSFIRNYSTPPLAVINTSPLPFSPEGRTQMRSDWETLMGGHGNRHRIAILDNDMKIQQLAFTPEAAQHIQSRQMSVEDVCSIWKVPSSLISQTHAATHSNLEQQLTNLLTLCLTPYLSRIEKEIQIKCLPKNSRMRRFVVEFDTAAYLRGSLADQTAFYQAGIQNGWFSPSDVRHKLGENKVPAEAGLEVYRTPVNYMSAALLVNQQAPESEPMPEPVVDGNKAAPELTDRMALKQYGPAYNSLMVDAVRRVIAGEKVTRVWGPLLESIQDAVGGTLDVLPDQTRLVDHLKRIESRAATWDASNVESIAVDELKKALKTFVFGIHEDAARKALGE
jgi:HK97 family phage portal protein